MKREWQAAIGILVIGLGGIVLYRIAGGSPSAASAVTSRTPTQAETIVLPQYDPETYRNTPEVQQYLRDLKALVLAGKTVLPLERSELDAAGVRVQERVLADPRFLADTREGNRTLHNDMMRIVPAPIAAMGPQARSVCATHTCYLAEKYNFVTNVTTRAIVDADADRVLEVTRLPNTQPDISYRLKVLAESIALHAPEVAAQLGHRPIRKEITMANVRGSMKESPCENTAHLCVAPTFADHKKQRALWAVVDLTDLRLAAAKWAGLGKTTTPACISERSLENRYIMEHFCQKNTTLDRDGWHMVYRLSASDGLEIRDVTYRGQPVLHSAKIVDWHVSYQQLHGGEQLDTRTPTYIEGRRVEYVRGENGAFMFGYNDAMGCPMFSTSVVLAFNGPQVRDLPDGKGFMLTQDFRNPKWPMACNYRYENRFEFYRDGSFRVVAANKGRGCGDHAIYRPVMRIDMALGAQERVAVVHKGEWHFPSGETGLHQEGTAPTEEVAGVTGRFERLRITDASGQHGYTLIPNHGQFGDQSRGDDANLFLTRFHADEGERDMLTLGSCCRLDQDGPERFLNAEPIQHQRVVLWYVPRIRNDARDGHEYCWADTRIGEDGNLKVQTWPCIVGPLFVPYTAQTTTQGDTP